MFVSILKVLKITFKKSKACTFKENLLKEHKVILKKEKISYNFLTQVKKKSFLTIIDFCRLKNHVVHMSSVRTFLYETDTVLLPNKYNAIFRMVVYYYKTIEIRR